MVEETGVDGSRLLVAAGKGELLGVSQFKSHLRSEAEIEHGWCVTGRTVVACANSDYVRHEFFDDLPALLAGISGASFAGQNVDDYLPLQG